MTMIQPISDFKRKVKEKKQPNKKFKGIRSKHRRNKLKSKYHRILRATRRNTARRLFRHITRYKFYNHNLLLLGLMSHPSFSTKKTVITLRVEANNIFCSFVVNKKIIKITSSGICRVSVSLKKQQFASRQIVQMFFFKIRKYLPAGKILINIIAPINIRCLLIKLLPKFKRILFRRKSRKFYTINVPAKKAFNGCRSKKKVRKKRRRRLVSR